MISQIKQFDLTSKVCLITGGAGLLGSAFVKAAAQHGAKVAIADIDEEKGKSLAEVIKKETGNQEVVFQKCDITKIADAQNALDQTLKKFGKIDALVNSAYPRNANYEKKFEDVSYEDFCENINLHLGGYFLMSQLAAKKMMAQNYGNIINISSIYGSSSPKLEIYEGTNMTTTPQYSATKAGIINLTKYLASYLAKYNIRVNAISPGGVLAGQPEIFVQKYSEKVILGKRMANTDDLTGALIFLLSDASKYITGQNIVVDGGFTL